MDDKNDIFKTIQTFHTFSAFFIYLNFQQHEKYKQSESTQKKEGKITVILCNNNLKFRRSADKTKEKKNKWEYLKTL